MSGTKVGVLKSRETIYKIHGADFYKTGYPPALCM